MTSNLAVRTKEEDRATVARPLADLVTYVDACVEMDGEGTTALATVAVTNSDEPQLLPASMADEPLAEIVVSGFKKFRTLIPYVIELRKRFNSKIRGNADIAGCKTWTEFCEKHLDRTTSAVQRAIAVHTNPELRASKHCLPPAPEPVENPIHYPEFVDVPAPAQPEIVRPASPHAEKRKNRNEPIDDFEEVRKVAIKMLNIGMREMKKTEANHSLLDSAKTWAQCKLADRSGLIA
jgi:hypothetical protein